MYFTQPTLYWFLGFMRVTILVSQRGGGTRIYQGRTCPPAPLNEALIVNYGYNIVRIRHAAPDHSEVSWKLYCAVKFISVIEASKLNYHYRGRESVSDTISAIWSAIDSCECALLTIFYYMHHYNYAATGDIVKCFIINIHTRGGQTRVMIHHVHVTKLAFLHKAAT
jgi:hypothetical protein